jgi:formylglycine-generating enzyme
MILLEKKQPANIQLKYDWFVLELIIEVVMRTATRFALLILVLNSSVTARGVTIAMVPIGNAGNLPDTRNYSAGSVAYNYRIGKYEVTAGQYTEFLNAVAKTDTNGLYHLNMANPISMLGANIQRSGSAPNYSYSVASDWADRPVNYVDFWDAARFVNWLHNGQPTGPQGPGTTEDGAYLNIGDQATFSRQPGAKYFIPTDDEWYKAAYHNQAAGTASSYFDYPTGTNIEPGLDITESTNPGNNANYYDTDFLIGRPYGRTKVGEFYLSQSTYGTFDQGGNVWEWTETTIQSFAEIRIRGGSFSFGSPTDLHAGFPGERLGGGAVSEGLGFRVAGTIPEPATLLIAVSISLAVLGCRTGNGKFL